MRIQPTNCPQTFNQDAVQAFLERVAPQDEELNRKFLKFQREREVEGDSRLRWCSRGGCNTVLEAPGGGCLCSTGRNVLCGGCNDHKCFDCDGPAHSCLVSCGSESEAMVEAWAQGRPVQPCPRCRRRTEKNAGCPHMSCICGHQYCWHCRGGWPCGNVHFNEGSDEIPRE